jgi:uncharacterized protein
MSGGSDSRTMAMLCHLSGLTGLVPFCGFAGPLLVWLMKKDTSPVVDREGKKALNFQFTMLIAFAIVSVTLFSSLRYVLGPVVWVFWLIVTIVAAVKTNDGHDFKYPVSINFIK